MTTTALAVHHVAVLVSDLARAERFYAGVLGLAVARRWNDDAQQPRSIWLTLGGEAVLMLEKSTAPAGARRDPGAPGWHCVALSIPRTERDAWRARLLAANTPIDRETDYTLYVRDPDGNLVGLSHFPERTGGGVAP